MIYIFLEMCEKDISISSFLIAAMNTTMNKLALERSFVTSRLKIYAQ